MELNQRVDATLGQIISQLVSPLKSVATVSSRFAMKFGVLNRVIGPKRGRQRLVVSRALIRTVLENAHVGVTDGHFRIR